MTRTLTAIVAVLTLAVAVTSAEARTRPQTPEIQTTVSFDRHDPRGLTYDSATVAPIKVAAVKKVKHKRDRKIRGQDHIPAKYAKASVGERKVVEHPAGCPHRAFCGCGTAKYLLGKTPTEGGLAIAANWLNFPKAQCAPNMAAARHGHVFAIIKCLPGNKVLAYDPNGGKHKTYIHVRSLASYTVVNPRSSYASAG